jgi:ribosomal protein S18 acetylase RimI-like enzyme
MSPRGPLVPRLAVAQDLPRMQSVVSAAYAKYLPRMDREPAPLLSDYSVLVAAETMWVVGDPIAGLVCLTRENDHVHVDNFAVEPESQGRGFGRVLMSFAEQEAARHGLHKLALFTNEAMTENLRMYARFGFHEVDRRTEDGYRRVFMEKDLPDVSDQSAEPTGPRRSSTSTP